MITEASDVPTPPPPSRPPPAPRPPRPVASSFGHVEWYESPDAWMPARPLPPRTNAMSAARRASVVSLSPGLSRKQPVVLERKIASYCFRFSVVKTAGSQDVSDVQGPGFLPSSSIVFAASGFDEC